MSFLDQVRETVNGKKGICETCGNLEHIGDKLIGCIAHDKLILPEYPPYHGNRKCKDWKGGSANA